jgi:hypothetical protein
MISRTFLITIIMVSAFAAEYQEFDVGAKWDIEYRVMKSNTSNEFSIKLINRNDYGVRLTIDAWPGMGTETNIVNTMIIDKKSSVTVGPVATDLSKYTVGVRDVQKGAVVRKQIRYYDMNGQLHDSTQQVFIGDEETDLSVLSGVDIGHAFDALGIEYNMNSLSGDIKRGTVYGYGLKTGGAKKMDYQYLEVAAKEKRNGLPIWIIQFELHNGTRVVSAFKKFQIY